MHKYPQAQLGAIRLRRECSQLLFMNPIQLSVCSLLIPVAAFCCLASGNLEQVTLYQNPQIREIFSTRRGTSAPGYSQDARNFGRNLDDISTPSKTHKINPKVKTSQNDTKERFSGHPKLKTSRKGNLIKTTASIVFSILTASWRTSLFLQTSFKKQLYNTNSNFYTKEHKFVCKRSEKLSPRGSQNQYPNIDKIQFWILKVPQEVCLWIPGSPEWSSRVRE